MRLTVLEPQFLTFELADSIERHHYVDTLAQAQGVMFLCPKCFAANGGAVGTHSVLCWFRDRGVPDAAAPKPGRWVVSGSSYDDLSLSPSVLLSGDGCGWHGFITAGDVTSC